MNRSVGRDGGHAIFDRQRLDDFAASLAHLADERTHAAGGRGGIPGQLVVYEQRSTPHHSTTIGEHRALLSMKGSR